MTPNIKSNEYYLKRIEKEIPEIKNLLEISILQLKLANNPNAFIKINFGYSWNKEPLIRCHIYKSFQHKIFSLYYNINLKKIFVRNELNKNGILNTNSNRIKINSINELKELLNKLIII